MFKDRTPIRIVVGVIALGIGLLWIGQGLGIVAWPDTSPMIGRTSYAWWGAALVAIGLALIKMATRR